MNIKILKKVILTAFGFALVFTVIFVGLYVSNKFGLFDDDESTRYGRHMHMKFEKSFTAWGEENSSTCVPDKESDK